jgi:hypothetical protein
VNITTERRRRVTVLLSRALAGCALVACVAAGCTSARSNLGTSDSSCYLALPAATKAVGSYSRLLGVRLFTLGQLRRDAPRLSKQIPSETNSTQSICALAFSGRFTSASVSEPHGRSTGQVAIVVLTRPSNRLLASVILQRLPLRFSHSHIG